MSPQRTSKPVRVGDVQIGGDAPIAVRSMCPVSHTLDDAIALRETARA